MEIQDREFLANQGKCKPGFQMPIRRQEIKFRQGTEIQAFTRKKTMKKISKEIQSKIDELSDVEKLMVVNYILEDLDKPDPEVDKLWAKEALRRQKAMRSGKMKTHSYEDVMRKYLK